MRGSEIITGLPYIRSRGWYYFPGSSRFHRYIKNQPRYWPRYNTTNFSGSQYYVISTYSAKSISLRFRPGRLARTAQSSWELWPEHGLLFKFSYSRAYHSAWLCRSLIWLYSWVIFINEQAGRSLHFQQFTNSYASFGMGSLRMIIFVNVRVAELYYFEHVRI